MAYEHASPSPSPEAQGSLLESGFSAVPLELNDGSVEYAAYMNESTEAIAAMADERIEKAKQEGWVASEEAALLLQGLLHVSCVDVQSVGISRNRIRQLKDLMPANDPRLEEALRGRATPLALLSLIESYPEIGSIELARVSHMLDATGANEMTEAVENAITTLGETIELGDPYYRGKDVAPPCLPRRCFASSAFVTILLQPAGFRLFAAKRFWCVAMTK